MYRVFRTVPAASELAIIMKLCNRLLCTELCPPAKIPVLNVTQNVTAFGDRAFTEEIN